jgi:hypothetical protein
MGWKVAVYTNPQSIKVRYRWEKRTFKFYRLQMFLFYKIVKHLPNQVFYFDP